VDQPGSSIQGANLGRDSSPHSRSVGDVGPLSSRFRSAWPTAVNPLKITSITW
jgi:hypothetical protein